MKNDKIKIPLGNGRELVAFVSTDPHFPEMAVTVMEGEEFIQDICIVRPHQNWKKEKEEFRENIDIDCLVFADEYNEDYTNKFVIKQFEGNDAEE